MMKDYLQQDLEKMQAIVEAHNNYSEHDGEILAKIEIIQHFLLYGSEHLDEDMRHNLAYLLHDIEKGVRDIIEFCTASQDYLYYAIKPERLEKRAEQERKLGELAD